VLIITEHHIAVLYICSNRVKCINTFLLRDVFIFIAPNFRGPNSIHIKCVNFGHIFLPAKTFFPLTLKQYLHFSWQLLWGLQCSGMWCWGS